MEAPPETALAIRVVGLEKRYGERVALAGVDLRVQRGEALGLLGPNGAGKTTTLRVLSTLVSRDAGDVSVLGLDPERDGAELRARLGVVPQEIALYGPLTARENLRFFGRAHGLVGARLTERVDWALEAASLVDRSGDAVQGFSGGMKRRLNLVASLLHSPEVVFLDEPTAGVDPQSRNHLFEMIEGLCKAGLTLIYTTHQMGEVERLCNRIAVMDQGRIAAVGTLAELAALPAVRGHGGARLELVGGRDPAEAASVLRSAGFDVAVHTRPTDLESIFLVLTGRALRDESETEG